MNAIRKKYRIREVNEFQNLLSMNIKDDLNAMNKPGFYIDFEHTPGYLVVLILGEYSLVKQIDNFSNHLVSHYKAELI